MDTAAVPSPRRRLTLGPLLFFWPAGKQRDFYARIADEAPVDTVYLGQVVCSKRVPFEEEVHEEAVERLVRAGKTVVRATLGEIMLPRERKQIAAECARDGGEIEINDVAGLHHRKGRAHRVGPFVNVYNVETLTHLARAGATHVTLVPELPAASIRLLAEAAGSLGIGLEVQVHGRASLAVSARCYHARAHGRAKDNCQFVCGDDPDGLTLNSMNGRHFLAINGIQTLSHSVLCLAGQIAEMSAWGVTDFRLSPHDIDMVRVAGLFRAVMDGRLAAEEAEADLRGFGPTPDLANGFWFGQAGRKWIGADPTRL